MVEINTNDKPRLKMVSLKLETANCEALHYCYYMILLKSFLRGHFPVTVKLFLRDNFPCLTHGSDLYPLHHGQRDPETELLHFHSKQRVMADLVVADIPTHDYEVQRRVV